MTDNFYPLTCDDDLLLIDKDTFTVARFKEFAMDSLNTNLYSTRRNDPVRWFNNFNIFHNYIHSIDNKAHLKLTRSCWHFDSEFIECQLLNLISRKGLVSGKLVIKSTVNFFPEGYKEFSYDPNSKSYHQFGIEIELQFCPDKPEPLETSDCSLDELRKQLQIHK
ncbi:MAG TPA: KGK domain-containing protein [Candidatus Obscuribacterales bacterium]